MSESRRSKAIWRLRTRSLSLGERTLVMGVAMRFGEEWDFPKSTHSQEALVWSKHISREYWDHHHARRIAQPSTREEEHLLRRLREGEAKPNGPAWKTVRDALCNLPPPSKRREPLQGHWQHPGARTYNNHTGSEWDEPAKALKAGDHGVPGGENLVCNRWGTPRYFTVREMARLQCLPDSYEITGSWKAATRQLGNAVPSVVGTVIGKHIKRIISGA